MTGRRIFTDGLAELCKPRAGEKYRPSNGEEGRIFESRWCEECKHDQAFRDGYARDEPVDGCEILALAQCYDTDDPKYPSQWQYGDDGQPKCTAFEPMDGVER